MIEQMNNVLSGFKIKATCVNAEEHNHFRFFDLKLSPGTKINKIKNLCGELALALNSHSTPIIKVIPEKGIVRLQTTFMKASGTQFYEEYNEQNKPANMFLPFYFGENDEGNSVWVDMTTNPHLLIAGSTGSGKSVFIHNIVANSVKFEDVSLFLVDTKRVEFELYKDVKFSNYVKMVVNSTEETLFMLQSITEEMYRRYNILSTLKLSNIEQKFNLFKKIIIIIDEVADQFQGDNGKKFEKLINSLAAKSRACGIYLIIATQRPSVDIITGTIKANFAGRMACRVSSRTDSNIILDQSGAEELVGRGDALFKNSNMDLTRLQISYVNANQVLGNINT